MIEVDREELLLRLADRAPGARRASVTECKVCGTQVNDWGRKSDKYCTSCWTQYEADRDRERRKERRREERADTPCATCGTRFTPPRSDGRYCSPACRQKAYRQRKR